MQSFGNFSQLLSQISQAFSSLGCKTQSLDLLDPNYVTEDEFMIKMQSLSSEIPSLNTILKHRNLFTLYPPGELAIMLFIQDNQLGGNQKREEIGFGANAKVFFSIKFILKYKDNYNQENLAIKTIEKINIGMLEFYIQECINQYNLIQINKEHILNFKGLVYISIFSNQASLYIPLELAEYSLYEYIQNNEITLEIYQYFYNFLIDLLVLLHSNSYAHRDIKPQNILFIKGQGWKLADFGESIKYQQTEGLYKIQGTQAFLPEEIRNQINKNKELHQNLCKNDIYAVICTLVMIKYPQFKSKDLMNYMDNQNLDLDLQNLQSTLNCDNRLEQLSQLRVLPIKVNIEVFKLNLRIFNSYNLSFEKYLLTYNYSNSFIEDTFLINIDTQLQILQDTQRENEHQRLQLYLTLLFPFQIHQLKNFNQQIINHQIITQNQIFFLDDILFKCIYLFTFQHDDQYVNKLMLNQIRQNNYVFLIQSVRNSINIGDIQLAKQLLEKLGKLMLQMDFNSNILYIYNLLHLKLHGNQLSSNENYIDQNHLNFIKQQQSIMEQNQFDQGNYLSQNKFIDKNTVDMIQLFKPLFAYILDQQTFNIVCGHIIENLGFIDLSIGEDQFKLGNVIKQQLINGGFNRYKFYMYKIIFGIVKLFLKYDLFEGLLDLLHYFLNFMKFLDRLIYHYIISVIQNLIYKLNIPIYHIKEDLYTQYDYNNSDKLRYLHVFLWDNFNKFYYNIIYDQQKTEQKQIQLDLQLVQKSLNELTVNKAWATKQCRKLFGTILQFAQFLGQIETQNQKYLSLLVIVSKSLYQINKESTKPQVDPILLEYFINCRQYNRITQLFNQQKTKEDLKPSQQYVKHLAEILLIKYNNFNRINSSSAFLYSEKLVRFALNQKFRQLFDLRQHLYVASTSKRLQKRLNVRDMCLKEQYLRI